MTRKLLLFVALCIVFSFPFLKSTFADSTFQMITSKANSLAPGITYTLAVTIDGGGSVILNATGPYNYNDTVQLTVYPNYGWGFLRWSGDLNGSNNPALLVMNSNKAVTAHLIRPTHCI